VIYADRNATPRIKPEKGKKKVGRICQYRYSISGEGEGGKGGGAYSCPLTLDMLHSRSRRKGESKGNVLILQSLNPHEGRKKRGGGGGERTPNPPRSPLLIYLRAGKGKKKPVGFTRKKKGGGAKVMITSPRED